jgi:hypothetical protein
VTRRRVTDAVTSLAAQTFPPSRRNDGLVVRDCARDAIDALGLRAMARESLSLAFAGLRVRYGVSVRDVRRAPWRPALAALTLPLAAALLCVWTFGFVPRYDHWPLGEGWVLLLGGSLVAVVGAALAARWVTLIGAAAVFVAAGAPYVGYGTEAALNDTATFFPAAGVDLGAASLIPALLLAAAALSLPRRHERSLRTALDRLALGLLPTAVALVHLLPREAPEPSVGFVYNTLPERGRTLDPQPDEVVFGDPYPFPELTESSMLLTALGVALLVAVVFSWRAARTRPEVALATALVLVSVAYPLAWKLHGYAVWPTILVPLATAVALTLRAAHAARRSSSATPASSPAPEASRR